MGSDNPCENCSLCCRYVALEIDAPEDQEDFDQIKWFLLHKDVWVFIDHDDSWNIQFNTPCEKLEGHLCGIHPKKLGIEADLRPHICHKHETNSCEKYGEGNSFVELWRTIEEFEGWLKKHKEYSKYAAVEKKGEDSYTSKNS